MEIRRQGDTKALRRVVFLVFLLLSASLVDAAERLTFIYYYAWYANEPYDGAWLHWQDYGHNPPRDISSSFYPKLGAYSSNDPGVVDQHMRWIAGANINVLIYSWWGRDDTTNRSVKAVLDSAADYNLSVVFLIEPYVGRTVKSICADIEYLEQTYGKHPAFFRISRKTLYNSSSAERPVFFIYQPDYTDHELRYLCDTVHNSPGDSILLLQSTDASLVERAHTDGIFAYEAVQKIMDLYPGITARVKALGGIFVPCVSPGFNVNKTFGRRTVLFRPRRMGKQYDEWWEKTLISDPEFVAIITFNEWHEGTQIEPAISHTSFPRRYLSYSGAFGKKGTAAQLIYLRRTARWIDLFQQLP